MKAIFSPAYDAALMSLIEARQRAGLTQKDLARLLGKPQSFISKYERKERRLDFVEYVTIAKLVGVDARAIVGNIEKQTSERRRKAPQ